MTNESAPGGALPGEPPPDPTAPDTSDAESAAPGTSAVETSASPSTLPGEPVTAVAAALSDGEWHRLHPASPLLKGGIFLLALIAFVISNLRERLIEIFIPQAGYGQEDPIELIVESGILVPVLLSVLGILLVLTAGFYVSWRMHTFRITNEVVEVRSGVLFRTNRKARLDRIQGINIVRPVIARIFGAARLEISQAGQDANVKLEYLGSRAADDLRREILRLASGSRALSQEAKLEQAAAGGLVGRRVQEFLAPELDPNAAEPASIVKLTIGRLLGSIALSGFTLVFLLFLIGIGIGSLFANEVFFISLFALIPSLIGAVSYVVQRFTKSLRYSIAGTPDGVRVGFGLLTTSNETLPPGRIHSVEVSQPLLWRMPGWWEIKVNRASHSSTTGAAGQANTTLLPVGSLDDVRRVLGLVLPDFLDPEAIALAERGLTAKGGADDGFTTSPRRAAVLRWFSWRRNGFAVLPGAILLRKGAIWRSLIVVPTPRLQSVSMAQGPILRPLRLTSVHLHTVSGPIVAEIGALDRDDAIQFFGRAGSAAVESAIADTSDHWGAGQRDQAEQLDQTEQRDQAEQRDQSEQAEQAEQAEQVDRAEPQPEHEVPATAGTPTRPGESAQ